jgi:hypothetical protein
VFKSSADPGGTAGTNSHIENHMGETVRISVIVVAAAKLGHLFVKKKKLISHSNSIIVK